MRPSASWAIDSEPIRARGIIVKYRAGVCNANRITVNDWRLLYLRKIIDHLNYSETHTVNLHHCDSIREG